MSGINAFYASPFQSLDPRQTLDQTGNDSEMTGLAESGLDEGLMGDGLDEIINQNHQEMQRRRTVDTGFGANGNFPSHNRRASMMEFGSTEDDGLAEFGFDPAPVSPGSFANMNSAMTAIQKASSLREARSKEDITMNTNFSPYGGTFDNFQNPSAYSSPMHASASMNANSNFMQNPMEMPMDYTESAGSITPINFPNVGQQPIFNQSPMHANFPSTFPTSATDTGGVEEQSDEQTIMEKVARMSMPGSLHVNNGASETLRKPQGSKDGGQTAMMQNINTADLMAPPTMNADQIQGSTTPYSNGVVTGENPSKVKQDSPVMTQYPNAYSASGFDMLGVLMRVAGRKNPEINIGPVDMSCAFVVCDITQHDSPIVYCSDVFERLTGYSKHEILGRNCRFLQSPDGKVQAGVKRKYVDDKSVLHLKNKIAKREEVQLSLINYRKGGQPFMNLLTMIPVQWDNDEYKYYVGFQVDLVEQPGSVAGRNPDGSYAINYQRGALPRYMPQAPETNQMQHGDVGQTIGRDEVSTVLSTIASGESELSKRIWDKVLLENTDDVVHVLSLKGLFLYLSPACRKVLEYDASELVGTALSSVCHPSDIVPVTRELKDTSSGSTVNVVFRIRRKHSGYTWFESHGSLHTEQGKGRKCIILVGRERPVYALARPQLEVGESEVWSKISTSGMILFVASNVRLLLDRTPEDLVGTSLQALMRPESRLELGRALEVARGGKRSSFKHDLQNRRGQILQAQTFLFPGDAEEGSKPTFCLAQTRLMKMSRVNLAQRPSVPASPRTDHASVDSTTPVPPNLRASASRSPSVSLTDSGLNLTMSQGLEKVVMTRPGAEALTIGNQAEILASEDNIFDELKTTRSTSWQFELRQMEKQNRLLSEELQGLISRKKKRKRRKGAGQLEKDCANCHTRVTPEWRRGPSGNRDLCNSCGLRWAKQNGRVSPRKSVSDGGKTPNHPNESLDQPIKKESNNSHDISLNSPAAPASGEQSQNHFQDQGRTNTATASAQAPDLDSHIAKTVKFDESNMQGTLAQRHMSPLKIDEDVDAEGDVDDDELGDDSSI